MNRQQKEFRLFIARFGTEWVERELQTFKSHISSDFQTNDERSEIDDIATALEAACGNVVKAARGRQRSPNSAASLIREFFTHKSSGTRQEIVAFVKRRNTTVSDKSVDMVANTLRKEGLIKEYGTWTWVQDSGVRKVA